MSLITKTNRSKEKYSTSPQMILLGEKEISSLIYHDIFDYPLTPLELIKWTAGSEIKFKNLENIKISTKNGFLFLNGKEGSTLKRLMRKRISKRKLEKAKKAAKVLSFLPTIKMIAVTGALAMDNANEDSDIDFLTVTRKGGLWTTRLFAMGLLKVFRIPRRKYGDKSTKDKLCLNIWLDESDLTWNKKNRNIFTSHEISQIIPLVNKNQTYERFLSKNTWIADFWPNATSAKAGKEKKRAKIGEKRFVMRFIEPLARKVQYWYMKDKITRETITSTRALFHPVDWASFISLKLELYFDQE
jgi:D-beta-D-heptose 7-phosphate kinase/D-beta-D-heptose 1-phosphate adenosyltransferase